jgi:prefoldin subunit 5
MELENALLESQRKLSAVETTNEVLRKRIDELENGQNTTKEIIGNLTDRISYIEKKTKIHKPYFPESR